MNMLCSQRKTRTQWTLYPHATTHYQYASRSANASSCSRISNRTAKCEKANAAWTTGLLVVHIYPSIPIVTSCFCVCYRDLCHESWTNLRLSPMFGCICPNNHMKRRCDRIFSLVNHNPCVGKCAFTERKLYKIHLLKKKLL